MPDPKLPIARLTDPRIMAAQIRAWAYIVDKLAAELNNAYREHATQTATDLAKQMRDVAQRESNAYPDREVKRSWEHRGDENQ